MWYPLIAIAIFISVTAWGLAGVVNLATPKPPRPSTLRYRLGKVLDNRVCEVTICSLALAGFIWLDSKFMNFIFDSIPYGWPSFAVTAAILLIIYIIAVGMDRRRQRH